MDISRMHSWRRRSCSWLFLSILAFEGVVTRAASAASSTSRSHVIGDTVVKNISPPMRLETRQQRPMLFRRGGGGGGGDDGDEKEDSVVVDGAATNDHEEEVQESEGEVAVAAKAKRKKKKKAAVAGDPAEQQPVLEEGKKAIAEAMQEKDSAQAMGDAIRDRADDWLLNDPLLHSIDATVSSVGWAMGTADDGGSVEAATGSVLAHYFLKSHGGAHALQSVCSLLAVLSSAVGLLLTGPPLQTVLIKRAFLCAMLKHLAGLLAATGMTATSIPKIGLAQARRWMEQLARDPVSQYVFYSSLLLVWLSALGTEKHWYTGLPRIGEYICWILIGPVLIREFISTAFVMSDVMLLLQTSSSESSPSSTTAFAHKACAAFFNAFMSLLVTPTLWRTSTAVQRQAILAKLVAKVSLALELCTGLLLGVDALVALWQSTVGPSRPPLWSIVQRLSCARLYANFLWVRRTKIQHLTRHVRGGASRVPVRILDVLYDPLGAMGIEKKTKQKKDWKDYAMMGLGLDEA